MTRTKDERIRARLATVPPMPPYVCPHGVVGRDPCEPCDGRKAPHTHPPMETCDECQGISPGQQTLDANDAAADELARFVKLKPEIMALLYRAQRDFALNNEACRLVREIEGR